MKPPAILFRCDANETIGFGHLARCIAWAEAFRQAGSVVHFAGEYSEDAKNFLAANEFEMGDRGRIVFVDGYHFADNETHQWPGSFRVWVDDFGSRKAYYCEAVVNFTVGAAKLAYPASLKHRFLGPGYFPARQSLRGLRMKQTVSQNHALVAIGGFDRGNYTTRVTKELLGLGWDVTAALGSRFAWREDFEKEIAGQRDRVTIKEFQTDSAELYRGANACVCGGGLTKYESAYLGLPAAVISQTPEQHDETIAFSGEGLACNIGFGPELADEQIHERLQNFLNDKAGRAALARRGGEVFPEDPAGKLVKEILAET